MYEDLFSRSGLSLERLKTLCEVAEQGGISKAADGDPVKQSQYSRQLRELETFFDLELTRRRGRNTELTDAGKHLASVSREILTALQDFSREGAKASPTLRIGAGESLLQWLVLPKIAQLRTALPDTTFSFRNLRGEDVIIQLQEASIDFGLVAETESMAGISTARLGTLRYRLFFGADAGRGHSTWRDIVKHPYIGLEGDGRQMRAIQKAADQHGVSLKPSVLCSSLPSVATTLQKHGGFGVLPETADVSGLASVDAPFLSRLQRPIFLVWSARRVVTRDPMPRWRQVLVDELRWR